jgi:very-short-patch-repair endonuclease
MSSKKITADFLLREYVEKKRSTSEIAQEVGCFPEQIRRALRRFNIPVRSRIQASHNFYDNGGENARKGYQFSEKEKETASISAKEYWLSNASKEARAKIAEKSQAYWDTVSDDEKQAIIERLHRACREAAANGSKAQRMIEKILKDKYHYVTMLGVVQIAGIGDLEVDIALPGVGIAIEVDGITHFRDVYSDDRYERAMEADKRKNDILTRAGWSVVRIVLKCDRYSKGACLMVCDKLHKMIEAKDYAKKSVSFIDMV